MDGLDLMHWRKLIVTGGFIFRVFVCIILFMGIKFYYMMKFY